MLMIPSHTPGMPVRDIAGRWSALLIQPRNVSQDFRDKVAAELDEATVRANQTIRSEEPEPKPKPRPKVVFGRRCKGCGVPWDELTPDCFTCASRRGARLETEYWREMHKLRDLVSKLIGREWWWPPNRNMRSRAAIAGLYSHKPRR